jgi:type II secretory pathway component PulL
VVRFVAANGAWEVRGVATVEEAATLLTSEDDVVLGLPITSVLAQRLRLPTVEADEFGEMVRIQIEKSLPYPPEEVTADYELINQTEEGTVISAVAVHNQKLSELAAPLISRGIIPGQVTVYGAQRSATHAPSGTALLIYPETDATVCAISEEGKLSFTRSLNGADASQLQRDLPQLALSAELQGIDTNFSSVLLDESLYEWRDTLNGVFATRADLVAVEAPPASVKLNLLPESWKQRRQQLVRAREWRKRLILAGAAYAAVLLLFIAYLFVLRFRVSHLDHRISRDAPQVEFIKRTEAAWKELAPAIDPPYYPIEVLLHLFESLPNADVRITQFNQSARQISLDGEANSAALVYQFAEKVKKNPGLQAFQFDLATPPRLLPNEHAQFRLEGKQK